MAVEPKTLVVYSRMNGDCKLIVQDSSSLCSEGEEVSYATLQLRAQAVDQVRFHVNCMLQNRWWSLPWPRLALYLAPLRTKAATGSLHLLSLIPHMHPMRRDACHWHGINADPDAAMQARMRTQDKQIM